MCLCLTHNCPDPASPSCHIHFLCCFIFGSFGLCHRTNTAILLFRMLGTALRACCTLGKHSTSELHTSSSHSRATERMSSLSLVKSFGFVSLSCDLEGASFPKVPLSRRSPSLQICEVVCGSHLNLRCLTKVLGS